MNDFIVELFLRRHCLRQDAELQLYIFLISLKAHYKKTATVHTFARLMDLLNDNNGTVDAHGYSHSASGHDHDSKGKNPKDKRDHFMREDELLEQEVQPHKSPLGPAYIPVLLFTRRILLKRAKVDLKALHREKIRTRFMSAASRWRMQEAAASAFKEAGTEASSSDASAAVMPINEHDDNGVATDTDTAAECQPDASVAAASTHVDANPDSAHGCSTTGTIDPHDPSTREEAAQHTRVAPTATGHSEPHPPVGGSGSGDTAAGNKSHSNSPGTTTTATPATTSKTSASASATTGTHNRRGSGTAGGFADRNKSVSPTPSKGKHKHKVPKRSSGSSASHGGQHGGAKKDKGSGSKREPPSPSGLADEGHDRAVAVESEVAAIDLPKHVLTEDNCTFWVSMEMAVRVLTVVLHWCTPTKRHAYMRSIERTAALLTSRGHITGVEASHSFIRSAMRKTIAAVESSESASGAGIGGAGITETMGGIRGHYEEGCGVGGVVTGDAALHDARIIIDMDRVVELVMEVMLLRQNSIEHRLKVLFVEGDENGDGVLSFEEFNRIILRAAPHFSERRTLRMFREALTTGKEGAYAIEKDTFCDVCRQHGLVQLIDIANLERALEGGRDAAARLHLLQNERSETVLQQLLQHPLHPSAVLAAASNNTSPSPPPPAALPATIALNVSLEVPSFGMESGESKELGKEGKESKALGGRKEGVKMVGGKEEEEEEEEIKEEEKEDEEKEEEKEDEEEEEAGVAEYHERGFGFGSEFPSDDANDDGDDSGGGGSSGGDVKGGRRAKVKVEGPKGAAALVMKGNKPPVRERTPAQERRGR
ncbi:unnamed protein product [Ectocarpus fasciculatus]